MKREKNYEENKAAMSGAPAGKRCRNLTMTFLTVVTIALFVPTSSKTQVMNPPGSLDTSFGTAGKVVTDFGNNGCDDINAIAVQPDGKIIAAGYRWATCSTGNIFTYDFALARYNPDGTLDQSFGTGGRVTTDFGNSRDEARAIALYTDGRILVAGNYLPQGSSGGIALARYHSNGTLDTGFDSDGRLTTTGGSANAVTLYPGGKFLVVGAGIGTNGTSDFGFTRYNMNGSLDTTFDTDGRVSVNFNGFSNDTAYAVTIQVDNKIVAAGNTNTGSSSGDFALVRLNEDGSLDTSFDTDGIVTTHFSDFDQANAIVQYRTPNSVGPAHFVVAGYSRTGSSNSVFAIARYRNDGSLDPTFDFDGKVTTDFGQANDNAYAVIVHPIGKIVVAGIAGVGTGSNFALARYGALGGLDTPFGTGGKVLTSFGGFDSAHAVALQADHKIIAAGVGGNFSNFDFALARYTNLVTRRTEAQVSDFDGDERTDLAVFRPSDGYWYIRNSFDGSFRFQRFGISTDRIVPGDYDGDFRTDIAIYRNGQWHLLQSTNGYQVQLFGLSTDIPVPRDYDGDGQTDLAVYRPSTGIWYLQRSTNGFAAIQFGLSSDLPVPGDYDGDGLNDVAVYRPNNGTWYLLQSTAGFSSVQFGLSSDLPVQGDYDNDGRTDVAVFRPSTGTWYLLQSMSGISIGQFGLSTDEPVPGDYDGDGRTDIAIFRPSTGVWWIQQSTSGLRTEAFGTNGDVPAPSAYIP
jgi:uncharacterized delta-60 repeat protein